MQQQKLTWLLTQTKLQAYCTAPRYKENRLTARNGENQTTENYGECHPAIKDHSKDLDNDGEITIKIISTIATDDPITNVLINCHEFGCAWNYLDVNAVHIIATYRHGFGFINSAPEITIICTQTNTDPALDPGDMNAILLDHAMLCAWRKTNDCDNVWCLIHGKGQSIRIQDMNSIPWQMPAFRIIFRAQHQHSSLEEDGERIHKHINKFDE
jgi:hypothetical protein